MSATEVQIDRHAWKLTSHDSASGNQGPKIGGHAVKLLELPPERLIGHNRTLDFKGPHKTIKLGFA